MGRRGGGSFTRKTGEPTDGSHVTTLTRLRQYGGRFYTATKSPPPPTSGQRAHDRRRLITPPRRKSTIPADSLSIIRTHSTLPTRTRWVNSSRARYAGASALLTKQRGKLRPYVIYIYIYVRITTHRRDKIDLRDAADPFRKTYTNHTRPERNNFDAARIFFSLSLSLSRAAACYIVHEIRTERRRDSPARSSCVHAKNAYTPPPSSSLRPIWLDVKKSSGVSTL